MEKKAFDETQEDWSRHSIWSQTKEGKETRRPCLGRRKGIGKIPWKEKDKKNRRRLLLH